MKSYSKLFFIVLSLFFLFSQEASSHKSPAKNSAQLPDKSSQFLADFFQQDTAKINKCAQEIADGQAEIVFVNIRTQKLTVVNCTDDFQILLETKISSGRFKHATPRGEFSILQKRISRPSKKYGGVMTYWNCLTPDEAFGIHGLRDRSYERYLGRPVSHGCIRLGKKVEKTFYALAPIGTKVLIE
jgi:lipoprotein-anchoring transpeptidase ErfK/SrfK